MVNYGNFESLFARNLFLLTDGIFAPGTLICTNGLFIKSIKTHDTVFENPKKGLILQHLRAKRAMYVYFQR